MKKALYGFCTMLGCISDTSDSGLDEAEAYVDILILLVVYFAVVWLCRWRPDWLSD